MLTYVSKDGAYGGPVAVAVQQCRALARRGHKVSLIAGWDGEADFTVPGVDVRLHRVGAPGKLGFSGLWSLSLLRDVARQSHQADVIHFHLSRDLIVAPSVLVAARTPLVSQAHGMIGGDNRWKTRLFDRFLFRRVLSRIGTHLSLTPAETTSLQDLVPKSAHIRGLRNAVEVPPFSASFKHGTSKPLVVFVSRLHKRKRPEWFVAAAEIALAQGLNAKFEIYGPDGGLETQVRARLASSQFGEEIEFKGALTPEAVLKLLVGAQVFVLPSENEPFPMVLLEAMSVGVPSILTSTSGLSDELSTMGSALLADTPEQFAEQITRLLTQRSLWEAMSSAARNDIISRFSTNELVTNLESIYIDAVQLSVGNHRGTQNR